MPEQLDLWADQADHSDLTDDDLADRVRDACLVEAIDQLGIDADDQAVAALAARRVTARLVDLDDRDLAGRLMFVFARRSRALPGRRSRPASDWARESVPADTQFGVHELPPSPPRRSTTTRLPWHLPVEDIHLPDVIGGA